MNNSPTTEMDIIRNGLPEGLGPFEPLLILLKAEDICDVTEAMLNKTKASFGGLSREPGYSTYTGFADHPDDKNDGFLIYWYKCKCPPEPPFSKMAMERLTAICDRLEEVYLTHPNEVDEVLDASERDTFMASLNTAFENLTKIENKPGAIATGERDLEREDPGRRARIRGMAASREEADAKGEDVWFDVCRDEEVHTIPCGNCGEPITEGANVTIKDDAEPKVKRHWEVVEEQEREEHEQLQVVHFPPLKCGSCGYVEEPSEI